MGQRKEAPKGNTALEGLPLKALGSEVKDERSRTPETGRPSG